MNKILSLLILIPFTTFGQIIISDTDIDKRLFTDLELLQNELMQVKNEVVSYDWNKLFPGWEEKKAALDTTELWPGQNLPNFPDGFNVHEKRFTK